MAKERAKEKQKEKETKQKENQKQKICNDKNCPIHGSIALRGRKFKGIVTRKHIKQKKVTIEFERMVFIRKYERFAKKITRIHAHLPDCMQDEIAVGDVVEVHETRPISKMIHFVVTRKIKSKAK